MDLLLNRTATMQKDILHIRVSNARSFYRNNMIGKMELERQIKPYLEEHKMSLDDFLSEDRIRRISSRKNKRRIEKAKIIGMVFIMILGLYIA